MQFSFLSGALLLTLGTISSSLFFSGDYLAGICLTAIGLIAIYYFGRKESKFELLLQDKPSS